MPALAPVNVTVPPPVSVAPPMPISKSVWLPSDAIVIDPELFTKPSSCRSELSNAVIDPRLVSEVVAPAAKLKFWPTPMLRMPSAVTSRD